MQQHVGYNVHRIHSIQIDYLNFYERKSQTKDAIWLGYTSDECYGSLVRPFYGPVWSRWCSLIISALLLVAPQVFANSTEQLKAFVTQARSVRGNFVQKEIKFRNNVSKADGVFATESLAGSTSNGIFMLSRPDKFIWKYQKPYELLLQADGENFYIYDKDLNQVTVRKFEGTFGANPITILMSNNDFQKNYTVRDAGMKAGINWLEFLPKSKDTQFERIGVGFRSGNLEVMELYDVFGNMMLLTFSDIQKNFSLPTDHFKFTVPLDAEVIFN